MHESFNPICLTIHHQPNASLTEGFVALGINSNCKVKLSKEDSWQSFVSQTISQFSRCDTNALSAATTSSNEALK